MSAAIDVVLPPRAARWVAGVVHSSRLLQPKLDVRRLAIPVRDLPAALHGFSIAQVSDLHVGEGAWRPFRVGESQHVLRQEAPNVVVNTGDFLQGHPPIEDVLDVARPLLNAPVDGQRGPANVAVLGNHDYFQGDDVAHELARALESLGVRVLANELTAIGRAGAEVTIAGLNVHEDGFERAVDRLRSAERPRIVLLHEADEAERLPHSVADLILAGHTHGGQVTPPLLRGLVVKYFNGSRYLQGMYRVNGNRVYINRGLGCTGLPVRFRSRPELSIFRLVR